MKSWSLVMIFVMAALFMAAFQALAYAMPLNSSENTHHKAVGTHMAEGSRVVAPKGFRAFCTRFVGQCDGAGERQVVPLTADRLAELKSVQHGVNQRVSYKSDFEIYGISEYWTFPVNSGDCEDYALEKRQRLISMGWPRSSLLFAAGQLQNGEYHLVLIAVTDQGDIVLDSNREELRHWQDMPIRWIMRQSARSERVWRTIKTRRSIHAATAPNALSVAGR
ncbi:MAG: transglutaminase-like cysteine peptidase [Proteobacteria bacterium]|nr:transglutaminase-like cysteine peptidase [Pseudomonadota bacterium]